MEIPMQMLLRTMRKYLTNIVIMVGVGWLITSCQPNPQATQLQIRVIVDGKELVYFASERVTVSQFLQNPSVNIPLGDLDKVNPPDFTQITDKMLITIIRVREEVTCTEEPIPYETKFITNPDLEPGTTRIAQAGENGTQRVCFNIIYEDNVEKSRTPGNPTILTSPVDEIVARGADRTNIEPISISGLLVYIIDGQARIIEGNSLNDRALPTGGNLDGFVFALSPNGHQLLYTRKPTTDDSTTSTDAEIFNELWVLPDVLDPLAEPQQLVELDNVLTADWVPDQPFSFSYSTLDPREQAPGYQALNDLNIARLDSRTGELRQVRVVVKSQPTGVYSVWGTKFKWSPDGKSLAWAQADGLGIVDFTTGGYKKLFDFRIYATVLSRNWVWRPDMTWSPASDLLAATIHGNSLFDEPEENSPVFDIALTQASEKAQGLFEVKLISQAGMWAAPQYSPLIENSDGVKKGYIAYLKARHPIDSVSSEYDLIVADRDGSNVRILFPGEGKIGIKPIDTLFGNEITWSPDGRHVALIYQGNVWIIDVETGRANQVTVVDKAHHPKWVK